MAVEFPVVGVLALQGGVKEHALMIEECGAKAVEVRKAADLKGVDAIVLPGGESTTMSLLSNECGLLAFLKKAVLGGMPAFGTCAGAILLAKRVGKRKGLIGAMDIKIERNAYGRQLDSFETALKVNGIGFFHGVFIRAPVIESVGKNVEVLSSYNGKPVLVREGSIMAATFHPELTGNTRIHELFLKGIKGASARKIS